jgi:hypothetical protein
MPFTAQPEAVAKALSPLRRSRIDDDESIAASARAGATA